MKRLRRYLIHSLLIIPIFFVSDALRRVFSERDALRTGASLQAHKIEELQKTVTSLTAEVAKLRAEAATRETIREAASAPEESIAEANDRIARREMMVARALRKAKCGVTIENLVAALGPPDREAEANASEDSAEKTFYWGTYAVTRYRDSPEVLWFTRNGERKYLCSK